MLLVESFADYVIVTNASSKFNSDLRIKKMVNKKQVTQLTV